MTRIRLRSPKILIPVLALLLLVAGVAVVDGALAATPAKGTISVASPSLTWTGGPFSGSNPTGGLVGPPDCTAPQSCDDYALTVSAPAGYGADHDLVVNLSWSGTTANTDFDLYLLDSAGTVIASAASADDPEVSTIPVPADGTYTVRVVPYTTTNDSYTATATFVADTTGGGGGGGGGGSTPDPDAPAYADYAAPSTLDGVNDAGEPSIGNDFKTGATMYQAGLSTYQVTFGNSTSPTTATWKDVSATVTNGCAVGSTESLDPILYTDSVTGRTFQSQLTGVDSATCYTDDDGTSWNASTGGGIPSGVDHQTIGGGPYAAGAVGPLPTSSYPDAVYYCSQDIATAFCAASNDGGTTFGAGVPTYNLMQCGGLHGHIRVAPDGTAYLPNKDCNGMAALAVSTDGGTSWTVKPIPGSTAGDSDPSVAVGRNGTVYVGFVGSDGKPGAAVSHDKGDTWQSLQDVGGEYGIKNAVFPTVIAGDDDRAAFAYVGTPTGGDAGATGVFDGVWHLYVDTTYDGGKTWITSDATPNDPVQRGSICTAGTTCGDDRNLLDFIDITRDKYGQVEVGFADGCTAACVTDPSKNTHDAYSTIARQSTGKTLFAKYDDGVPDSPTPTTPPTSPQPNPSGKNTAPVAKASSQPTIAFVGQRVTLSGSGSHDAESPRGDLRYAWDFGNQGKRVDARGEQVTAKYGKRGYRTATMKVTDPQGLSDVTKVRVQIARRVDCEAAMVHKRGPWRTVRSGAATGKRSCDNRGRRTHQRGHRSRPDTVVLSFSGKALAVNYGTRQHGGYAQVFIDGRAHGRISFEGAGRRVHFGPEKVYSGLAKRNHRLTMVIHGAAYLDTFAY